MILVTGESAICLVVYSDKHVAITSVELQSLTPGFSL